jgi:hypothetical protein
MNKIVLSALAFLVAIAGAAVPVAAEEVVLISTHTRDFIGADAGAGTLKGVPLETQALVVDRIALDGAKMAFRARDGKFVRAGVSAKTLLAAGSDHIRGWETFEIVKITAAKFAIKSVQNGRYVSLGADGRLSATANDIGTRETFSARAAAAPVVQPEPRPGQQARVPQGDADLAGRWSIHRVRTFDGSLTAIPGSIRRDSFVRIRGNGQMSASTGCNDISGRVRHEDELVQFGQVMTTKKLCLDDTGAYEMLLLIAFDHGRSVDDRGNQLRFFDVNGDPVLVLRRN